MDFTPCIETVTEGWSWGIVCPSVQVLFSALYKHLVARRFHPMPKRIELDAVNDTSATSLPATVITDHSGRAEYAHTSGHTTALATYSS